MSIFFQSVLKLSFNVTYLLDFLGIFFLTLPVSLIKFRLQANVIIIDFESLHHARSILSNKRTAQNSQEFSMFKSKI